MELTEEDIREFAALWEKEFHETLSPGDARQYATSILELYALITEPVPPTTNPEAKIIPALCCG